jgi:hypothetical protein
LQKTCIVCQEKTSHLASGESLCKKHAPEHAENASTEELEILAILTYSKSFSILEEVTLTKRIKEIVDRQFIELHS